MITLRVPGDKSISHRALLLAPMAAGVSRIRGLSTGRDVETTLRVVRHLGAEIEAARPHHGATGSGGSHIEVIVGGAVRYRGGGGTLDCGNSGTTVRLALGLLAGAGVDAVFDGDASLRARPMRRVAYPLQAMGARIEYMAVDGRLPLRLLPRSSGSLRPLRHRPRVASAQVKSAILLAGVAAGVGVEILEPAPSRDHTERMLRAMGVPVANLDPVAGGVAAPIVRFDPSEWDGALDPLDLEVPGDPSSAAFLVGAALLAGREIRIEAVADNPTRTAFLDVLEAMGVALDRIDRGSVTGEPVADWIVRRAGPLGSFDVGGDRIPSLIDELPLLAVLAARARGTSRIRDAGELRVKESDRIALLAGNLAAIGVPVEERPDGLVIEGTTRRLEGRVVTGGDHRMAMAFATLAADGNAELAIDDPECAAISFPEFATRLEEIVG